MMGLAGQRKRLFCQCLEQTYVLPARLRASPDRGAISVRPDPLYGVALAGSVLSPAATDAARFTSAAERARSAVVCTGGEVNRLNASASSPAGSRFSHV